MATQMIYGRHTVWKVWKFTLSNDNFAFFYLKSMILPVIVFSRNFVQVRVKFSFFHTVGRKDWLEKIVTIMCLRSIAQIVCDDEGFDKYARGSSEIRVYMGKNKRWKLGNLQSFSSFHLANWISNSFKKHLLFHGWSFKMNMRWSWTQSVVVG